MANREKDARWHDITATAELDLYLGPETFETETVVTAVSGEVSGELDRVVSETTMAAWSCATKHASMV